MRDACSANNDRKISQNMREHQRTLGHRKYIKNALIFNAGTVRNQYRGVFRITPTPIRDKFLVGCRRCR